MRSSSSIRTSLAMRHNLGGDAEVGRCIRPTPVVRSASAAGALPAARSAAGRPPAVTIRALTIVVRATVVVVAVLVIGMTWRADVHDVGGDRPIGGLDALDTDLVADLDVGERGGRRAVPFLVELRGARR